MKLKFLHAIALGALLAASATATATELNVRVSGITPLEKAADKDGSKESGAIYIFVFTSAERFPKEERAVAHVRESHRATRSNSASRCLTQATTHSLPTRTVMATAR